MMKFIMFIIMLNLNIMFFNIKILLMMMNLLLMIISMIFLFSINYNYNWMNVYYWMGMDSISFILILLSMWIVAMMFMVSYYVINKKMFSFMLLILLISLMMCFMSMNYFLFYLFFEISLIPTFLLIMGWGYQPERMNASMYMLLYTMFASLPLLILLFILFNYFNSMSFLIMLNNMIMFNSFNFMMYMYMLFAFLIKLPMFLFHMWLPKAHVEAPVSGSMILAGVMLKLGGYGIMRSMLMMLNYSIKFNLLFMIISLLGMLILSLVCLRQLDMKLLVAYSSVVHMAIMLMGLMSMFTWGYKGGYMMMIGHGLCSSAMFILVNLLYERSKSRNMFINKGMIYYFPSLTMWWFMFCACNMSSPVSLNLISELMIISILLNWSFNIIIILMLGMLISALYSLYLFSYSQHGKSSNLLNKLFSNNINNYMVLFYHWIPLNFMIIKMELFI